MGTIFSKQAEQTQDGDVSNMGTFILPKAQDSIVNQPAIQTQCIQLKDILSLKQEVSELRQNLKLSSNSAPFMSLDNMHLNTKAPVVNIEFNIQFDRNSSLIEAILAENIRELKNLYCQNKEMFGEKKHQLIKVAIMENKIDSVSWLVSVVDNCLLIDSLTEQNDTALMIAAYYGHFLLVKWILQQRNGQLTFKNKDDKTALTYAKISSNKEQCVEQYLTVKNYMEAVQWWREQGLDNLNYYTKFQYRQQERKLLMDSLKIIKSSLTYLNNKKNLQQNYEELLKSILDSFNALKCDVEKSLKQVNKDLADMYLEGFGVTKSEIKAIKLLKDYNQLPTNATEKMKELLNRDVDAWVAAADAFFEKVISKSILNYFKDKVLDIWNYCFSEDEDIFSMSEEIEEVIEYYLFALKKVDMANMENQRNHIHKQLGILYWQSKNFLAAVEHFNLAGETGKIGTKNSWWTKGNANYKKKDFHKSVECYKIALLLSNPAIKEDKQLIRKVLFILGKIYWEGHGNFLPNYQIAFEYFGKASRAGSTRAIDLLSNDKIGVEGFYLLGLKAYGKGNIDLAVKYWHSALPYGYALLALAKCYLIGIGVEKNIQLACLCFTNIIELNNRTNRHIEPAIMIEVEKYYHDLESARIKFINYFRKNDFEKALDMAEWIYAYGDTQQACVTLIELADLYYEGTNVAKNNGLAFLYYHRAMHMTCRVTELVHCHQKIQVIENYQPELKKILQDLPKVMPVGSWYSMLAGIPELLSFLTQRYTREKSLINHGMYYVQHLLSMIIGFSAMRSEKGFKEAVKYFVKLFGVGLVSYLANQLLEYGIKYADPIYINLAILLDDSFKGYHAWDSGYKSYLPSNLIPQSCNADELKTLTREMVQYPIVYAGMKATGLDKMPKNSESTFFNTLAPAGRMLACANTAKAARQYVKPKPIDRVAAEKQKTTNLNELRRSIKLT